MKERIKAAVGMLGILAGNIAGMFGLTVSDNIYVMDAGKVAESGSHEELLEGDGIYAKLWNTQQSLENFGKDGTDI